MRNYIVGSVVGHALAIALGGWVASYTSAATPLAPVMKVDLTQLDLPSLPNEPEPLPEAPAEPEAPAPELVPETIPPDPEPEVEIAPPDPELPPEPKPLEPEPEPERPPVEELPDPEEVKPDPKPEKPKQPETPERTEEALPEPAKGPEPERVSSLASVQAASSDEGVDDYFLVLVQRKIARRWDPTQASARGRQGVTAVVKFRVGPGGEIIAPELETSSGLSVFDRQALGAIMAANPLPAPPPRFRKSGLNIRFSFVYNP